VNRRCDVAVLARFAGLVLAAAAASVAAACSDGTTPTCPETDGGCSYVPVEIDAAGDGVAPAAETGGPDAANE
jgi:hypothetical protein